MKWKDMISGKTNWKFGRTNGRKGHYLGYFAAIAL
jgi:hypothetical protein